MTCIWYNLNAVKAAHYFYKIESIMHTILDIRMKNGETGPADQTTEYLFVTRLITSKYPHLQFRVYNSKLYMLSGLKQDHFTPKGPTIHCQVLLHVYHKRRQKELSASGGNRPFGSGTGSFVCATSCWTGASEGSVGSSGSAKVFSELAVRK